MLFSFNVKKWRSRKVGKIEKPLSDLAQVTCQYILAVGSPLFIAMQVRWMSDLNAVPLIAAGVAPMFARTALPSNNRALAVRSTLCKHQLWSCKPTPVHWIISTVKTGGAISQSLQTTICSAICFCHPHHIYLLIFYFNFY